MDLHAEARRLFAVAVQAADPAGALRRAFADSPPDPPDPGGRYLLIALGKAAIPMAAEALQCLDAALVTALVVTNYENARPLAGADVLAAGHPMPDANGERAGQSVVEMLQGAGASDRVVVLVSGGGSALLPAPAEGLTLADKIAVNRILLANGFEIGEVNLIRQQLSRLKGGGMLRLAAPAPVAAYILSDVVGDDLRAIASGPTVGPLGDRAMARVLLQDRGCWDALPISVQRHLEQPDLPLLKAPPVRNNLVGSNRASLGAMATAFGVGARLVDDHLTGDVEEAARKIIHAARTADDGLTCLVFGGETTVTLRGKGKGGRNQELALRVALGMPDLARNWVFLSGGTDGRDGPTDAAGGVVDAGTAARIRAAGGAPETLLANNDSYQALSLAGDLLVTGATGTNVADIQALIIA